MTQAAQAMSNVESHVDLNNLKIDPRTVGRLDPEIAGEGSQVVILENGDQVPWTPPTPKPCIPDWSTIKPLQKYFNRKGFVVYPAWLYHPIEEPRLVRNRQEAAALGVEYRRATVDERGKFGVNHVWDWSPDSQWRPQPWKEAKFDPRNPGHGKVYVPTENRRAEQNQLVQDLVPAVAAAVAASLQASGGPAKPTAISESDWKAFLEFKAFKESQELIQKASGEAIASAPEPTDEDELVRETEELEAPAETALSAAQEWQLWEEEAKRKGIKVDGRWGIDRLKEEVEKAA